MSDFESRSNDPRLADHEIRIARLETEGAQMASKLEVVQLGSKVEVELASFSSELRSLAQMFDSRFGMLTEKIGELAKIAQRQAEINNENMREAGQALKSKHEAEVAALKQQLEDAKPLNRAKVATVYVGLFLAASAALGVISGALLWWVQQH